MKKSLALILFMLALCLFAGQIASDRERWKPFYMDVTPNASAIDWMLPFRTPNRHDTRTIRIISDFGAKRQSYLAGHYHTGIDLQPKHALSAYIDVLPLAAGRVCSIHLADPHRTVVLIHRLPDGSTLYTSYKHFQEIVVQNGQEVTADTRLGRLYTRREALAQGGNYDHLHLEIRSQFDDYGVASWATMTRTELDQRFIDPAKFIRSHIH